jgi:molecular chaperone GrpE
MKNSEKKKNQTKGALEKEGQENLLDTFGNELHLHLEEEKKEEKEIREFKKKVEEKEKEAKDHYDRYLRMAADFENYKKRALREKEEWAKFSNEELIKAILPFIDNLENAVLHAEKPENTTRGLIEGLRLTQQQLLQTLARFGLSPVESVGKPFDPSVHEAMMVVETDQHEPDHVVEEFRKGYLLKDRLLRPATVSVSRLPQHDLAATQTMNDER